MSRWRRAPALVTAALTGLVACGQSPAAEQGSARWNGTGWAETRMPVMPRLRDGQQAILDHVAVAGASGVWARGGISWDCDEDCGGQPSMVMHWDGSRWSYSLRYGIRATRVSRLDARSLTGLWLAEGNSVILYLSDGRWVRAALPRDPQRNSFVRSVAVRPGAATLWAVGFVAPEADEAGEDAGSNGVIWTARTA